MTTIQDINKSDHFQKHVNSKVYSRGGNSCSHVGFVVCRLMSIQLYGTNMTRLLNRLQFLNLKMIRLLKGSIVLTHLSKFMKEKKKNTIFCINPVDPDYKKKKKQIGR